VIGIVFSSQYSLFLGELALSRYLNNVGLETNANYNELSQKKASIDLKKQFLSQPV
jgi:hypothetical protein